MRVWLACFFVLFALAEFFDWLQEFNLPLPIYILGGAFLAVASNYDKIIGYYVSDAAMPAAGVAIAPTSEQNQLILPTQPTDLIPLASANPDEDTQIS